MIITLSHLVWHLKRCQLTGCNTNLSNNATFILEINYILKDILKNVTCTLSNFVTWYRFPLTE